MLRGKFLAFFARAGLSFPKRIFSNSTPNPTSPDGTILIVDTNMDRYEERYRLCKPDVPMDCSLRGAVFLAGISGAQGATIQLEAGTYGLSLPGTEDENIAGDLDLHGQVILAGAGCDLP